MSPMLVPPFRKVGPRGRSSSRGSTVPVAPAAPDTPSTPSPADVATALYSLVSWVSARQAQADIYFGTAASPPLLISKYVGTSWVPPTLAGSTTYYWKVVAFNAGGSAVGPIWSFTTLAATAVPVMVAGVLISPTNPRAGSLSIQDALAATPNTAHMTVDTTAPAAGNAVRIGLGSLDDAALLFAGEIQADDPSYVGIPTNGLYPVTMIDHTFTINKRRPFGVWVDVSASIIGRYLVAVFAPGFTANQIQDNLPAVSITFDGSAPFMVCMSRLASAISGFADVDYTKDVRLFLTDTTNAPDPVDAAHPPLGDQQRIRFTTDLSQVRTRGYGKGHGETVPCDVAANETIVPIVDAVMFSPNGGQAIAGTISDGAQSQILDYAGIQLGGDVSMVGPATAPLLPPGVMPIVGTGIEAGIHGYAVVWGTALGKSLPSPIASVMMRPALLMPGVAPGYSVATLPLLGTINIGAPGEAVAFAYSYSAADTATDLTAESVLSPSTGAQTLIQLTDTPGFSVSPLLLVPYSTDTDVNWIHLWVSRNGGVFQRSLWVEANIANSGTLSGGSVTINGGYPVTSDLVPSTGALQQARLTVPLGPDATTYREIYRTSAGGSQLKFQQTISNNTSIGPFTDSTPDASLGANAPTSNTSGIAATIPPAATFDTTATFFSGANGLNATLATSGAPVVTTPVYTFVAADVGAQVYIKAGVNWTVGLYRIVSVAAGAATLDRACAPVASPTQATYGVDYSGLSVPRFSVTDLAIDGGTSTICTSATLTAAGTIGCIIGNSINITAGTGFTVQQVTIRSTSGANISVDKALGVLSSSSGSGTLGGVGSPSTVFPSSASMLTAAWPYAAGGWVKIGSSLIRYSGISGNTLIGIPASGIGSITRTILYGEAIETLPALTGVNHNNGLRLPMASGSSIHIWVQRDDLPAQAALGQLERDDHGNPTDGIREYQIIDERRGLASLTEVVDADLAQFARPIVTVTYPTRDPKTKSGKTVHVDALGYVDDFTIQSVTITFDGPALYPRYSVSASSVAFTLMDLLRLAVPVN